MRVILISPPSSFAIKQTLGITGMPLGLAYLASALERENQTVKIIDAPTLNWGMDEIRKEIDNFQPQVVGITSTTPTIYDAYQVAELSKKINPRIKVVMGGPHVTFTSFTTLKECPAVDIVVRGEGEETLKEIIKGMEGSLSFSEIKGITYRQENKIFQNPDRQFIRNLDEIPTPAYHLLPLEHYRLGKHRFGNIITSRGCPFSCIFCSSSQLYGKVWRARTPENVVQELKLLRNKYKIREIEFLDDTFTLDRRRAEKICELIIKQNLDISWSASSRVNTLDPELATKMRKAGCHTIYLGIESGSQKILDLIGKGIKLSQSFRAVEIARKAGLNTLGTFIIGIPGETVETIKKTINLARKLSLNFAQFTLCTPYPGTKLFKIARERGLLFTLDWSKYTILDPVMQVPGLIGEKLSRWLERAYLSFYLRPRFIWQEIKRKNFFFLKKAIKAAIYYINGRGSLPYLRERNQQTI